MKAKAGDPEKYKAKLLHVLSRHVGEHNIIDAGALYREVFGLDWRHKINDTRGLRTIVTALRNEGVPIGSRPSKNGGGYWLVAAGSELEDYLPRQKRRALKILAQVARMEKKGLPELLGQMKLNLEA